MSTADELKNQGNEAFVNKKYDEAIEKFTEAIAIEPSHILYSNRSACYASNMNYQKALDDAEVCTKMKSDWAKGWSRKGAALHGLGRLDEAIEAYNEGIKLDGLNAQLKAGLDSALEAKKTQESTGESEMPVGTGLGDLGNLLGGGKMGNDLFGDLFSKFGNSNFLEQLKNDPKIAKLASDPSFIQAMQDIKNNPMSLLQHLSNPKFGEVFKSLMSRFTGGAGGVPNGNFDYNSKSAQFDSTSTDSKNADLSQEEKIEDIRMNDYDTSPVSGDRKAADVEKQLGNEAYKKKNFIEAISHYNKAWDHFKDIIYLNNLAAAYYEDNNFDECIKQGLRAVEEGRMIHADYKLVAKAFQRIAIAYQKKGDLGEAIKYLNKSLTEYRNPDVSKKLKEIEKEKAEKERLAYIDPIKAEEARLEANECFKNGDFPGAVKGYTEAIKRNPEDARGFANRAAAYIKLLSLSEALKDIESTIKLDPLFVKAYIRKAQVYMAKQDYSQAYDALLRATEADKDPKNNLKHEREIQDMYRQCSEKVRQRRANETEEEARKRIESDPELVKLLRDPAINSILMQLQEDSSALETHMKNPEIRQNLLKLIAAGVIKVL